MSFIDYTPLASILENALRTADSFGRWNFKIGSATDPFAFMTEDEKHCYQWCVRFLRNEDGSGYLHLAFTRTKSDEDVPPSRP